MFKSTTNNTKNWADQKWVQNVEYPTNPYGIKNYSDEQIINLWRFLPPSKTYQQQKVLSSVIYEFNKRFRYAKKQIIGIGS